MTYASDPLRRPAAGEEPDPAPRGGRRDTHGDERPAARALRLGLTALVTLALLYGAFRLYLEGLALLGALFLAVAVGVAVIFSLSRFYAARFIFPGVAAVLIFVAFPMAYTIWIGFTNYSSLNLLTYERAQDYLLARGSVDAETEQPFLVAPDGDAFRIWLPESGLLSAPVPLDDAVEEEAALSPAEEPAALLERRDAIALRGGLQTLSLTTPEGVILVNAGLRTFASVTPTYRLAEDGVLVRTEDGATLTPDQSRGFYVTEAGETVPPGWRVAVGLQNFERIFQSRGIREPIAAIFLWTVIFAAASVVGTFAIGLALAVVLQWPHLSFKPLYRILLILPYAVPAFISILVFRGLFNQNFGEINLILGALFGIRPDWFSDPILARTMILVVNIWLGYPYMMLIGMGFLQAVPEDHKKAAALEGASALRVFFTITLPQILPPFLPLLIASFAFNFNNLVVILLLTRGLPDMPGTIVPAGQTDILASFTYRIAFSDSLQQFGLAGAITLLIFVLVAGLSYANFVAMRRAGRRPS
ncbi:maltose ABC transporter permease MalF [Pseudoroseicyclus tamaricis]|uniref:Maltose/maltodextrin transport system permease protein n=1 Tax=Pseudoroseicyclus tamaricis TaxID=2705421 RepID=A0A6B2K3S1_9RHOB|nr:maltose ABC transporter permease MalF [Pseudoroseicyclus tamaricis]NDV02452.1 maltose ABC transporter permease MalF [Pseudoroseicyclus tamaricis]